MALLAQQQMQSRQELRAVGTLGEELLVPWTEAPTGFKYLKHIQKVLSNITVKEFQENKVQDVPHPDIDSIHLPGLRDKERTLQAVRQTVQTK